MNVGQVVLLIAPLEGTDCYVPVGAVGEIVSPLDECGEYDVLFPGYPCSAGPLPDWVVPATWLVPINPKRLTRDLCARALEETE